VETKEIYLSCRAVHLCGRTRCPLAPAAPRHPLMHRKPGAAVQTLKGHTSYVKAVVFSLDSKLVASASNDKTVQVWDAATGAAVYIKNCSTSALAFSEDGLYLCTDQGSHIIDSNLQTKQNHNSTLFIKNNWISFGNTKLLWLPLEYRPSCLAFQDNLLVLGLASGIVQVIEFNIP
jgi:WD40 repeat protein